MNEMLSVDQRRHKVFAIEGLGADKRTPANPETLAANVTALSYKVEE